MNLMRQKVIWLSFAAMAMLFLAGCVSSERLYEDVSLSRDDAYRQWETRKERQQRSQTYISG
jgi:outer membrane biogenesis lipoprotein LolB